MSFFPSEAEQIQSIAEAESVTPSAFSMFISQDDIDHILRAGGNADETELWELTDSAIAKLRGMSDEEYDALDLFPDFEKEDMDAE